MKADVYRHHSPDGKDMTLPVLLALRDCPDGETLFLGGGEWHFYPTCAFCAFYAISNNDPGRKPIAFPLLHRRNLTIDGEGARLIFHGKILPFVIDDSEGVTIRNLSIDYAEPMYFQAEITAADHDFVEMTYDETAFHCRLDDDQSVTFYGDGWANRVTRVLVNEFDPVKKAPTPTTATYRACFDQSRDASFMGGLDRHVRATKPAPNRLRLEGELHFRHTPGMYWLCTHNDRCYPGIFMQESRRVRVESVRLTHTLSMGIIAQMTEDITLDRVEALPGEGRLLSTDADATHFVNCSGRIHLKDCRFESMMDDAGNFHGIYMPVERRLDDHRLLLTFGHFQQEGVLIFHPGDRIRLTDHQTMIPYQDLTVRQSTLLSGRFVLLEVDETLPEQIPKGHVVENYSRMPAVHIEHCICGHNRPRGFLISTCGRVLIEDCTFFNMNAGVDLEEDANSWFESGPCTDVTIRHNHFRNAAYAGSSAILINPQIREKTGHPYHGCVSIEENDFEMHEPRFLQAHSCEEIVFTGNTYTENTTLPPHPPVGTDGIAVSDCGKTEIDSAAPGGASTDKPQWRGTGNGHG